MTPASAHDEYAFVADLYDFVGPYRDRPDIPFFVEAALDAGGPVLELGCGTGRVLIPAARAGATMVGLDMSPSMLAVCRASLSRESEKVRSTVGLVCADMRDFTLAKTFALAMFPFRSFQHLLSVEDQVACLGRVHRHLTDGGQVIIDVFNPSIDAMARHVAGKEFGEEPEFAMPDGRRVVRRHRIVAQDRFNQVNQIELVHYITYPDGRSDRLVHAFAMRYFFRFEVEHLLARCGFHVEQVHGDYDRSPYGSRYPGELVVVARKAA